MLETIPFASSRSQLNAHFARLRTLLQRFLDRHRARFVESPAGGLHTFVTWDEVQHNLAAPDEVQRRMAPTIEGDPDLVAMERELEARLSARDELSAASETPPALSRLMARLRLGTVGRDLVVAVAAPELSVDLHRVYRHAWADFTARHGNIPFYVELLAEAGHAPDEVLRWLTPGSPLIRYGLVTLMSEEPELVAAPPSMTRVMASPRLVAFLTDVPVDPSELPRSVAVREAAPEPTHGAELAQRVRAALAWAHQGRGRRVLLEGPEGAGRRSLVARFSGGVVSLDLTAAPPTPEGALAEWQVALVEARLRGCALFVAGLDALLHDEAPAPWVLALLDALHREPGPVVLGCERAGRQLVAQLGRAPGTLVQLQVPFPDVEAQRAIWRAAAPDGVAFAPDLQPEDLAGRYNLTGAKIRAAVANAAAQAATSGKRPALIDGQALTDAVRAQLAHRLGDLASRVQTPFTRADLVLPAEPLERIEEILIHYRQRHKLLFRWGFDRLLAYGRGMTALFSGPPGTGKTMAAAVIARELGMEIFQVDLSQVVDKYIGETEKKLARIFDEAGRGQAILLFDEADSVFAKRTEVRNSTDRYANLGVNFLLQRMESYEGITILTTNLESSIDDAFKRRIRFRVNFPAPDAAAREALWRAMIPEAAPRTDDIDFAALAWDFELVGADIKTVVYKAAAAAAERGEPISHALLRHAAKHLYRERGKIVREDADGGIGDDGGASARRRAGLKGSIRREERRWPG